LARALFSAIADLIWLRRGPSVRLFEANLRPVVDADLDEAGMRELTRAGLRSYLRYWCEAFRLPATSAEALVARVVTTGEQHVRTALADGRGVICALPHMANWDHAGAWMVATGEHFTTVAERLKPASLFDRFVAYREKLGMEVLAAADPDVFAVLSVRLREGRLVALVADRDLSARGVEVTMGRGRTRMPVGPAALAIRTGAALLPTTLWYEGQVLHVEFHERVERPDQLHGRAAIAVMTQDVADVFGPAIEAHPQDWHMFQRFWLDDVPAAAETPRRPG
jgi:KDO2-lipid IV(A) lauroyltransferase